MEIKLVRHCETEWNRLEKCQGVSDICLNANGINQSNLLKECFSNLNIDLIDRINPFGEAYSILAKTMSEKRLKQIHSIISSKRISLTLEEARELASEYRKLAKQGIDPINVRLAEKRALLKPGKSLAEIATAAYEAKKAELKNLKIISIRNHIFFYFIPNFIQKFSFVIFTQSYIRWHNLINSYNFLNILDIKLIR